MSSVYTGNPSGKTERQAVSITIPADGDALTATSNNVSDQALADLVKFLLDRAVYGEGYVNVPATANTDAVKATGNGSGKGGNFTGGGTNATGVVGTGGATNGHGVSGQGTGTGVGVVGVGGGTSGVGGNFAGGGPNGTGVVGGGVGTGAGVSGTGGATNGVGVTGQGTGTGAGVTGTGGASNGHGVSGQGTGTGIGLAGVGGGTNGAGVFGQGGATNGHGVQGSGTGTGKGGKFAAATTAQAAIQCDGWMDMSGSNTPSTAADKNLTPQGVLRAACRFTTTAGTPPTIAQNSGFNVNALAIDGSSFVAITLENVAIGTELQVVVTDFNTSGANFHIRFTVVSIDSAGTGGRTRVLLRPYNSTSGASAAAQSNSGAYVCVYSMN